MSSISEYTKGSSATYAHNHLSHHHSSSSSNSHHHHHHHHHHSGSFNGGGSYNNNNNDDDTITAVTSSGGSSSSSYQGMIQSMATLSNIGNSCYLNSVVYTLRFTPNFMHNLHHLVDDLNFINHLQGRQKTASLGRASNVATVSHLNALNSAHRDAMLGGNNTAMGPPSSYAHAPALINNGLSNGYSSSSTANNNNTMSSNGGSSGHSQNGVTAAICEAAAQLKCHRQTATEKLHELYQNLTRNENVSIQDPFQPVQFLNAIQDVSTTFEGNQQQDAHEFLMCILDSIRETCQTLKKKFAESAQFQQRLAYSASTNHLMNGNVDHLIEPSNLSTAQIMPTSSTTTTNPNKAESFKCKLKKLKLKTKRKDEKVSVKAPPPSQVVSVTDVKPSGKGALDIVVDVEPPVPIMTNARKVMADADLVQSSGNGDDDSSPSPLPNGQGAASEVDCTKLESDFFSSDFEGVTVSTTKCLSCETETEQKETMIDIAIPISGHEPVEALDNPQLFFRDACITRESFRGDNKYRCEKCSAYTEAIRSISFEVLPRLLIIQLKRFSGGMEKINSFIPTPFILQCFCRQCCQLPDDDQERRHVYKLYSVITHVGATMSAGHYITYTCSLDCYCDYLGCTRESEKLWKLAGKAKPGAANGCADRIVTADDCEPAGGKATGVTNLSNPGHHEKVGQTNLIGKLTKNRFFKNKTGIRAKFTLGSSSSGGGGGAGPAAASSGNSGSMTTSSLDNNQLQHQQQHSQIEVMNSHNELIERHLVDAIQGNDGGLIGSRSSATPQLCRSLTCCTIKAKAAFFVKQMTAPEKGTAAGSANGVAAVSGVGGDFFCSNPKHPGKMSALALARGGATAAESGDMVDSMNLTASTTSSTSTASSSNNSVKFHNQNGGGTVAPASRPLRRDTPAAVSDEPVWYMCDDDKIKSMSQHEFKELLSSNRKIAITPYLLFYARTDL